MRAIGSAELLDVWEAGTAQPRWQWANALLCAAWPELDANSAAALTIGQRDRRLLELRETLFGSELECQANCPSCRATAEMTLRTFELRGAPPSPDRRDSTASTFEAAPAEPSAGARDASTSPFSPIDFDPPAAQPLRYLLHAGNWTMDFRVPNGGDLAATAATHDPEALRDQLLTRCVCARRGIDHEIETRDLPVPVLEQVIAAMSASDPDADLRLDLTCPECSHRWTEAFDIVAFLRTELDRWAQRTLHDVHVFATAYGWTEHEVLALSPTRRAHYRALIET